MSKREVAKGRFKRATMLGGMAAGLAGDVLGAAAQMGRKAVGPELHRRAAERLLRRLGEMKGLPMKMGQMLSYVDDAIPPEHRSVYQDTLKSLRVRSEPMAFEVMKATIEEELGRPLHEVFATFDPDPMAAASIGQVYRAALPDGTPVAVKVQYPGIKEAIESDLQNIDSLISALTMVLPRVELDSIIRDITGRLSEECDYRCEAANQRSFVQAWHRDPNLLIPPVFESCSATRVLVSRLVNGRGWEEFLNVSSEEARCQAGRTIFRFVFESLFCHGMFNGDPHPGNYLFLDDGRVAFLDYGCVQRFSRVALADLTRARHAVVAGVRGKALRPLLTKAYGVPEDVVDEEVWALLEEYVLASFEPLIAPQPFRYDRSYTERLTRVTLKAKVTLAKKLFKLGIRETKQPGVVFMQRINFGLNSILATLGAEEDWPALMADIDSRAGEPRQ